MRRGSVIVDLAAENGGNAACTQADKAVVTPNGVTCLGYTDLVSRLPTQATAAFGNNVAKFLLSIGPQTTGNKGEYYIDYEDDAVRGMLAVHSGELTYPAPPYNPPEVKPPPEAAPPPPPVPEWKKYASSAASSPYCRRSSPPWACRATRSSPSSSRRLRSPASPAGRPSPASLRRSTRRSCRSRTRSPV